MKALFISTTSKVSFIISKPYFIWSPSVSPPHLEFALGPAQHPIHWVPGDFSLGVKLPVWEADHSPSSIAKVKYVLGCTSILPIYLHGTVLN